MAPADMSAGEGADLAGREVLLCLAGGIACYKAADLASRLLRRGAGVSCAMTESATRFVAPLTFQTLTARQVFTSLWQAGEKFESQHLALTERAELMIVAPATADIIAKMACGIADELVSALALAAWGACPMLIAPAMNTRMWNAPPTQANMALLGQRGVHVVGPATGRLACGATGPGRMAEPEEILAAAVAILKSRPPK
jgi:phosphopantothenoylcysteine decarboxylase/phosphopantothenate--cysteine ligase